MERAQSIETHHVAEAINCHETSAKMVDLYASSKVLMEELGSEKSGKLTNQNGDVTHFNDTGARVMADLMMKELPRVEPKLLEFLKAR